MTWACVRIAGWLYLGLLVVAPMWWLRIFLWCWIGCFAVCAVLLGFYGVRAVGRRVRGWRAARRRHDLFPYGYRFGAESVNREPFVRRETLP